MQACKSPSTMVVRPAITVLEVLFAMFVAIVGILGIASLIPLASRNASESTAHTRGQMVGQQWFQDFSARGLNDFNSFSDAQLGFNWAFIDDSTAVPSFFNFSKTAAPALTGSRIHATSLLRLWAHEGVCLDPRFLASADVRLRSAAGVSRVGAYRPAVFPFFEDGVDPTLDPYLTYANPPQNNAWDDQPRLLRIGLTAGGGLLSYKHVESMFTSVDDMTQFINEKDKLVPATRLYQEVSSGVPGQAISDGEFSWIATVTPKEPTLVDMPGSVTPAAATAYALQTTDEYLLSLVVFRRRDLGFIPPSQTVVSGNMDDKPEGERLCFVVPLSGDFNGGNGGRVRLISTAFSDDKVHVGDWIMLGRHFLVDPHNAARRYAYMRWYRVISVDGDAKRGSLSTFTSFLPFNTSGANQVWARDVILEGPDFAFGSAATPTTGALVKNAVMVFERPVIVD